MKIRLEVSVRIIGLEVLAIDQSMNVIASVNVCLRFLDSDLADVGDHLRQDNGLLHFVPRVSVPQVLSPAALNRRAVGEDISTGVSIRAFADYLFHMS